MHISLFLSYQRMQSELPGMQPPGSVVKSWVLVSGLDLNLLLLAVRS